MFELTKGYKKHVCQCPQPPFAKNATTATLFYIFDALGAALKRHGSVECQAHCAIALQSVGIERASRAVMCGYRGPRRQRTFYATFLLQVLHFFLELLDFIT